MKTPKLGLALAFSLVSACLTLPAHADYAIGLWGDVPYSDLQATVGVPNMIADMNAQSLAFTVNDGDLKAGNATAGSITPTSCADAMYIQALNYMNQLKAPAMFTPGDNDWTDCDRPKNGAYNAVERLDYERSLFFADNYSQGMRRMRQQVQTAPLCLNAAGQPAACVENRRWNVDEVTYVTLNIPGSCNNLCDTTLDYALDQAEFAARNAANIAWLKDSFAVAKSSKSAAIMVISQANPGWDRTDATRAPLRDPRTLAEKTQSIVNNAIVETDSTNPDGYKDFLNALRDEVVAFRKPVSYVHGDSHYFRVDKPLLDATGKRLENFTRVETFGNNAANGNNDVHWLKVKVEPKSREVFSYQPQIVPGNRTAVPAP